MSVLDPVEPSSSRRRSTRLVAAGIAALVAVLYIILFLVLLPHLRETDNPAPVFAVLAVVYGVLTWLLARRDARWVHVVGAGLQALLLAGYLWIWSRSATEGDEQFFLDHLVLGVTVAAAQVALLALLVVLARPQDEEAGGSTSTQSGSDAGPSA